MRVESVAERWWTATERCNRKPRSRLQSCLQARVVPPAWCDVAPYKDDPNDEEPESPSECPTIRDIRVKTAGSRAQSSAARSPSEASPKPVPHVSAPVPVDDTLGVCRNAVK